MLHHHQRDDQSERVSLMTSTPPHAKPVLERSIDPRVCHQTNPSHTGRRPVTAARATSSVPLIPIPRRLSWWPLTNSQPRHAVMSTTTVVYVHAVMSNTTVVRGSQNPFSGLVYGESIVVSPRNLQCSRALGCCLPFLEVRSSLRSRPACKRPIPLTPRGNLEDCTRKRNHES